MKETFKDYVAKKLYDLGIQDNEGNNYSSLEVFERFDDFLEEVSKEELIAWADEFKNN